MKKEVHLRLLKRLLFTCILTAILAIIAVIVFESRRVDQSAIITAAKESTIFSFFFTAYLNTPDEANLAKLEKNASSALEQSPYMYVEFLTPNKKLITHVASQSGAAANQLFINKGIVMIPSDKTYGSRIIANKRIYLRVSSPVKSTDTTIGYINGIYQVTLDDTKTIISRFILTGSITLAAVFGCSLFCYLGFLLLNNRIIRTIGDLSKSNTFLLKKLGAALAKSDTMDTAHSSRVLIYSVNLAEKSGLARNQTRSLILGGFLHDLEMLPISPSILYKKGSLDEEEYNKVKLHARNGSDTLKKFKWLHAASPVILHHHEKYDGSGYPTGLKHEKIPTIARIFAIADAFDAMTSTRPYRETVTYETALTNMDQNSGTHFDPVLLASFSQIAPALYHRITALNSKDLEKELDKLLQKYLKI